MFGRKKQEKETDWQLDMNIEGQLQAMTVSRNEGLPGVNPDFDQYPVNMSIGGKMTLKEAVGKAIEYGRHGIYTIIYRNKREDQQAR